MALFIDVDVDRKVATDAEMVKTLVEVCPVNIFERGPDGALHTLERHLDECTLCELCLNAAPPGTVRVKKLYGDREILERRA
jgi:NAD-dependent dihydropyrimidine dehydrogenase PreA subunit